MNFRVGQKVVCVDDAVGIGSDPSVFSAWPQAGSVYTVRESAVWRDGEFGVRLEEITAQISSLYGAEYAFFRRRFRPVKTTSIDVFTAMLAPEPNKGVKAPQKSKERV